MEKSRYLFLGLFLLDLVLHIFISLNRFLPSFFISTFFSGLMFISWFYAGRILRTAEDTGAETAPLIHLFKSIPYPLRLVAYFFIVYALANFFLTMEIHTASGWIDTHPGFLKLRGISGFWVMFAFVAYSLGEGRRRMEIQKINGDSL